MILVCRQSPSRWPISQPRDWSRWWRPWFTISNFLYSMAARDFLLLVFGTCLSMTSWGYCTPQHYWRLGLGNSFFVESCPVHCRGISGIPVSAHQMAAEVTCNIPSVPLGAKITTGGNCHCSWSCFASFLVLSTLKPTPCSFLKVLLVWFRFAGM